MPRVLVIILVVALMIYALIDLYQAGRAQTRLMPRWLWAVAVVCVPALGPLGWLTLGRPAKPTGPALPPAPGRPRAPDDDPDFLRGL